MLYVCSWFAQPKCAVSIDKPVLPKPLSFFGFAALGKPASLTPLVVHRLPLSWHVAIQPALLQTRLDQECLAGGLIRLLFVLAALEPVPLVSFPAVHRMIKQLVQHGNIFCNVKRPDAHLAHNAQLPRKANV